MEVDEAGTQISTWAGYVDWRNKPAVVGRHGGMVAAVFVLVVEVLENLAYLANASNLVLYLIDYMHMSPSHAANGVTNFMGTAFLLALLGGFLADAFFTTYRIYLISAAVEFLGLVLLTVQANSASLKPAPCNKLANPTGSCEQLHGGKAAMFYIALYLAALGVGGIKGSLPSHGAEQFDQGTAEGRKQRSTFFNYFVFSLSGGALIAVTFVVWVEDNKGWQWGLGLATAAIALSIPVFLAGTTKYRNKIPSGSPLTTIFKVLMAAMTNGCNSRNPRNAGAIASMTVSPPHSANTDNVGSNDRPADCSNPNRIKTTRPITEPVSIITEPSSNITEPSTNNTEPSTDTTEPSTDTTEPLSGSLKFLNRAVSDRPTHMSLQCTAEQVEDVKVVVRILPIFASTIILNCCLAQLSTFSVQQAASMDTKFGSLKVPPASLPVFPVIFIMILAPVYDHLIIPFARRVTKTEMGISHLQRIGIGLALSVLAMAVAALVEIKRKRVATHSGLLDSEKPLPITFLWIAFQYLFVGSADLFTLAGLLEFFFSEAPANMRSLATSLSWASLAMGYYMSSVIVSIINGVTGHKPWLKGGNLNHYHLERFYWLMCVLSGLNFANYLFWASKYKYRSAR